MSDGTVVKAQKVLELLEAGRIPESVLDHLINTFASGDPIREYWEEYLPEHGAEALSRVFCCYRTTGGLKPPFLDLQDVLYRGFVWCSSEKIGDPVICHYSDLYMLTPKKGCEHIRFDDFLTLRLTASDPDVKLIEGFDPWKPACGHAPLVSPLTRERADEFSPGLLQAQTEALGCLMRWIAAFMKAGKEHRANELSHLMELIADYGNMIWAVQVNGLTNTIRPIIVTQRVRTLRTGSSSPNLND